MTENMSLKASPFFTPARLAFLSCLLVPLGFGVLSLVLGQDINWDLRNYHWYNPYAFLTGRWERDFGAGSFYNPALDVPIYLAALALPARVFGFLLGVIHGLNYVLLFAFGRVLFAPLPEPRRLLAAGLVALVGVIGGGHIGMVGTTFHDNIVSFTVIGAVLIVARAPAAVFAGPAKAAYVRVGIAGLLLGIGVGLKQPTIAFAIGFCLAFLVVAGGFWRRMFLSFWFGIGITAGLAASCGFFMWHLWRDFHNPFFPYFNNFFASPLGASESYRDLRFIPKSLFETLAFPVVFSFDPGHVGEIVFRDFRILAAYVVLLASVALLIKRRRVEDAPEEAMVQPLIARYLIAAAVLTFVVWIPLFSIYRYIIPLEMLAPLVCAAAVGLWPLRARTRTVVVAVMLILVTVTAKPGTWLRREGWSEHLVEVTAPPLPADTLVALVGIEPLSYVIPALRPDVEVLRLQGYLTDPKDGDNGVNREIRRRFDAHTGPISLLYAGWERETVERVLPYFGLTVDFDACGEVQSNLKPSPEDWGRIFLCTLTRTGVDQRQP
jgi:uncharacterized membrane protein